MTDAGQLGFLQGLYKITNRNVSTGLGRGSEHLHPLAAFTKVLGGSLTFIIYNDLLTRYFISVVHVLPLIFKMELLFLFLQPQFPLPSPLLLQTKHLTQELQAQYTLSDMLGIIRISDFGIFRLWLQIHKGIVYKYIKVS